ncbi:hypothetical protein A3G67_01725 [Candidatus Roizmanbacteria bacterium RIFCSPLOWO2_12_FULL_40_12]|uniref:GIY-YIG domain-containing protein n=1 Tax=Candidatus Roizmanbacteria bacterium RIFCSPLOWO2_01_FULL_40_42 TaxID=1802066 RepID=A0A1F7J1W9_9BACT|nr:MAG: hypothetical protein A2779_00175 [Candidatus Roizmanbacteria bacterium RIFCSPHIGHO2_01_FULL_40_98]OGK27696.1 MAG: hypothetical protein A3C31_04235 [Candidatus Roizmanbacteria bacterium RIFCSPHIGHO2_02_FULL_40_53]OGK29919.1 MAG: hypothetical protein A2W49_04515 [Candidatus Roizmanbacteria bacterium RIFCSPHIGHO2_12_41_18]OGK36531.1 MAG: hypothetical protein A3E69_04565 [Candidatus Roizmanbacteria bacterium RIFCSPHIGHO2_12_FULL_40_130]OGK49614.1 MAG: hypothetical protein A3B50_04135 [Candi
MYFVYAVYNKENKKLYIGQTENLEERLKLHKDKKFKNSFTARFSGKWDLIYKEELKDRREALVREKQLKSYRGRESLKRYIPL